MELKNRFKLLVLTDGFFDHASSRIRAVLYFNLLIEKFHCKIYWLPRIPNKGNNPFYKFFFFPVIKRWFFIKQILGIYFKSYDIAYIQRFFLSESLLNILIKRKVKIIYDFDDAIYLDKTGNNVNKTKTLRMLSAASHIIVSANELRLFCIKLKFDNVSVITTPIDLERFAQINKVKTSKITIGWIGSYYTTSFLKIIEEALTYIYQKFDINVLLVGADCKFSMSGIPLKITPWTYDSEPELLGTMDIGIMPLTNDQYAKGKGGYKLYQYMAVGIPVIASPVGINNEIVINDHNGYLASNTQDWIRYFSVLIENPELRKRLGGAGKKMAEEKFSRKKCFSLLSQIITDL